MQAWSRQIVCSYGFFFKPNRNAKCICTEDTLCTYQKKCLFSKIFAKMKCLNVNDWMKKKNQLSYNFQVISLILYFFLDNCWWKLNEIREMKKAIKDQKKTNADIFLRDFQKIVALKIYNKLWTFSTYKEITSFYLLFVWVCIVFFINICKCSVYITPQFIIIIGCKKHLMYLCLIRCGLYIVHTDFKPIGYKK